MHPQETASLDREQLAQQMRARGLSQIQLARQLGVSPLTVGRWLSGKVRRVSLDNLQRLVSTLELDSGALRAADDLDAEDLSRERQSASRLVVGAASRMLFYEAGRLAEYEQLILAMLDPLTPAEDLLEAYSQLIILAGKRGRFDLAERYALLKLRYAQLTGNRMREQEARVNLLTAQAQAGRLVQSCRALEDMLSSAESCGAREQEQVALINLNQAYRLRGMLKRALAHGLRCLELLQGADNNPRYLGPLCANLAATVNEAGVWGLAREVSALGDALDTEALTPQEDAELEINRMALRSLAGQPGDLSQLPALVERYLEAEYFTDSYSSRPALVLRRAGRLKEAREYLNRVQGHPACGVYEPPFIEEEWGRLEAACGNPVAAAEHRDRANELFRSFGMQARCCADPALESISLLRLPASQLKQLSAHLVHWQQPGN